MVGCRNFKLFCTIDCCSSIVIIIIIIIITIDDGEEYDRRLKKLMQECLPGILADVVEERPADPIEFIAHALYKYKVKSTLSMLAWLLSSADNICKQFGSRSGPTDCRSYSGSKLFDTLIVFLSIFWKCWFWKKSVGDNKTLKITQHSKSWIPNIPYHLC